MLIDCPAFILSIATLTVWPLTLNVSAAQSTVSPVALTDTVPDVLAVLVGGAQPLGTVIVM